MIKKRESNEFNQVILTGLICSVLFFIVGFVAGYKKCMKNNSFVEKNEASIHQIEEKINADLIPENTPNKDLKPSHTSPAIKQPVFVYGPPNMIENEIGVWHNTRNYYLRHYVQIASIDDDKVMVYQVFADGSADNWEYPRSGNDFKFPHSPGDYYKLSYGELSIWDSQGKIYQLEKVR